MSKKILLADDSVTIQKVVELTFQEEDFEVMIVGNGLEALEKIKESRPDIILADISMPGLNGIDLCEKLKSSPEHKSIPIILLINSFEEFDRKKGDKIGVNGYIEKPFESHDLVDMVQSLTEKKEVGLEEEKKDREDEKEEAEAVSIDEDRETLPMEDDENDEESPISPSAALELDLINEEEVKEETIEEEIEETIAEEPEEIEKIEEDNMLADGQIEVTEITGEDISLQEIQEEETPPTEEVEKAVGPEEPAPEPEPEEEEIERIDEVEEIFKEKEKKEKETPEAIPEEAPPVIEEPEKPEPILEKASDETAEITDKHEAPATDDKEEVDLEGLDRSLGKYLRVLIEESFEKSIEKMAPRINEIVENITKEIVPEIAESIIKKEIEKLKGGSGR